MNTDARTLPATMDAETLEFIQGLFALVREGDTQQLGAMVTQGVPVNFRNEKGDSLIMLASYHGHLETSRLLLEAGADANVPNDQGQTPLAGVAYKGYLDIAELLLDVVRAAHDKGLLHFELTPQNLFLTDTGFLKVLDFDREVVNARAFA